MPHLVTHKPAVSPRANAVGFQNTFITPPPHGIDVQMQHSGDLAAGENTISAIACHLFLSYPL
jgi:hypothetical protein